MYVFPSIYRSIRTMQETHNSDQSHGAWTFEKNMFDYVA